MGQSQQYTGVIKSGRAIKMTHRELQGICKSRLWGCGRGRLGGVRQQIIHCHAEEVCDTLEVIDCGRRHAPLTYATVAEPSRLLKLRYANVPALAKCGNIGKHQRLHPLLFQVFQRKALTNFREYSKIRITTNRLRMFPFVLGFSLNPKIIIASIL